MINRLSAVLCGLFVTGIMLFATAQSSDAAVPANPCIGNWVNAPCMVAEVKLAPAEPPLVTKAPAPRREVHRSKRAARQKVARQKVARHKVAQVRIAEPKPIREVMRVAKVCTGNWVNAACASPE